MEPQLWLSAWELGSFYALLALAYFLVLQGSGFFNFAVGAYAAFAGLGAAFFVGQMHLPLLVGLVAAILAAVVVSVVTELLVVRPIKARLSDELAPIVAVVALLFVMEQLSGVLFGRRPLPGARAVDLPVWQIAGVLVVDPNTALLIALTIVTFAGVSVWLNGARLGRMLRAVGDNEHAARVLGLPVGRVRLAAFALAGALCGLAGLLIAPKAGVNFQSGLSYTLVGFLALVLGGTGTVWAPLVGGYLFGLLQIASVRYFGGAWLDYATLVAALLLFAFRPEGIFARRVRA